MGSWADRRDDQWLATPLEEGWVGCGGGMRGSSVEVGVDAPPAVARVEVLDADDSDSRTAKCR